MKQLQRSGIDPSRSVFEITELGGASQRLPGAVARSREADARIVIDDFAAGYAQLDRLQALPPDILKLDMRLRQAAGAAAPAAKWSKP